MPASRHPDHLFVVRIRHEPSAEMASGQWRGSVEHVPSHQRLYFTALSDLTDFIALHLQAFDSIVEEQALDDAHSLDTDTSWGEP